MPKKSYHVKLTDKEYLHLCHCMRDGDHSIRAIKRARILLLADEGLGDEEIAETVGVSVATVPRVRKNYHTQGLPAALHEKPRSGTPLRLDGRVEATLAMLACSTPPAGYGRRTLQLLADQLVELQVVEKVSLESIRTLLKKMSSSRGPSSAGV
jgi:putative transposase